MVMDVDHFKQVNDTLGHAQGDEVIRRVARTISNGLRGADLAARLGGDEFSVLLPDTTAAQAAEVAERIRQRMLSVKASAPGAAGISVSIGVADLESGPVKCCEDLVELADKSLYAVKARGRNKVLLAQTVHGDLQFNEVAA
jgi:diguanylate cyclase (GGDEF)-like protein